MYTLLIEVAKGVILILSSFSYFIICVFISIIKDRLIIISFWGRTFKRILDSELEKILSREFKKNYEKQLERVEDQRELK